MVRKKQVGMSTSDIYSHLCKIYSLVNTGPWITVGEDSVQYRKQEKNTAS